MSTSPDRDAIANPKTHYGPGKKATRSFVIQRVSGALNVAFTLFFVWFLVRLAGAGRAEMVGVVANPLVAILLAAMIVTVAVHMRLGMREVIEDYVHDERLNRLSLLANTAFAVLVAALALLAIIKIVFWG